MEEVQPDSTETQKLVIHTSVLLPNRSPAESASRCHHWPRLRCLYVSRADPSAMESRSTSCRGRSRCY